MITLVRHLLINLILLVVVFCFLFYKAIEILSREALLLLGLIGNCKVDNINSLQLDLFQLKRKMLSYKIY